GAVEPNLGHLAGQLARIALSACPPHRRPSIGPTRKRAYARREASSAKTAVNEALTLYLIRATHQMLRPLIHNLHFCNSVLYFQGIFPSCSPIAGCAGDRQPGNGFAYWSANGLFLASRRPPYAPREHNAPTGPGPSATQPILGPQSGPHSLGPTVWAHILGPRARPHVLLCGGRRLGQAAIGARSV